MKDEKSERAKDDKSRPGPARNHAKKSEAADAGDAHSNADQEEEKAATERTRVSKSAAKASAETSIPSETPVTEKPVPLSPVKKTSEYVVTVDNLTGLPVKIEKLTESGERKELSKAEYLQVLSYGNPRASLGYAAAPIGDVALAQQYYRGVFDYLKRFVG